MKKRIILTVCVLLAVAAGALAQHWTVNPHAFRYDMTAYVQVASESGTILPQTDYEVAAFCNDECRGVGKLLTAGDGTQVFQLRIRSNAPEGETIDLRVYQKSSDKELYCDSHLDFVEQSVAGMPSEPIIVEVAGASVLGDGITIADANIPQGGKTVVEVQLTSAIMSYSGFQFDVMLPTGISLTKVEKADRLTTIENYTLQQRLTDATNNVYTVSGYNSVHQSIAGTSGAVAYLTLQATANVTVGDVLTAKVQNVVLSTINEENIDAASSTFAITIEENDGCITLDKTKLAIEKGQIEVLTATCPSSWTDKRVTWESSDPTVVIVKNGKIKGMKVGTATITCTSVATGLKATCVVTVTAADAARSLDGNDDDATEIDDMDVDPAATEPFDVYDLNGRKVLRQATSLDALPRGTYIVNGKKIMK